MKLVIQYETGDGYTWNATNYLSCEAESKDELQLSFLIELEALLEQKNAAMHDSSPYRTYYFKFQSHTLDLNSFIFYDEQFSKKYIVDNIQFLTLDEFWESQLNQDFGF